MKILSLILLSLILFSPNIHANDKYLFTPLASYHMKRSSGDCEFNPGLKYQHFRSDRVYYTAGAFLNSRCNVALIAMIGWESLEKKRLLGVPYGYGVMAGFTTGYDYPVIGTPYIRLGDRDDRFHLKVMVLPHPTRGIYGIGVGYRLGN